MAGEIDTNDDGESWDWLEGETLEGGDSYRLCRCGASENKPFCDGSHASVGFQDESVRHHTG